MPFTNWDWITTRLATGGQINSADDINDLWNAGITHIIDCCEHDDRIDKPLTSAMAILSNPTADDGTKKTKDWFEPSVEFAMGALAHPGFRVLAHCAAGVNRGPSTAYAIMRAQGWVSEIALALIHTARIQTVGGIRYAADADEALKQLGWVR